MFGRSKRILALDIGSSEIKALEVMDTGSGVALTGFQSTKIGSQNETIFAVKELLRKGAFKTKRCVTAQNGAGPPRAVKGTSCRGSIYLMA